MHQPSSEPIGTRTEPPTASARLTLLACVVALAVLLTQVPGPAEALDILTGATVTPTAPSAPLVAIQSILLTTAGLLAWLIAGWAVVVLGVGLIARLPGRPGRRARRLLPRIAPASVGRLVFAAVGVSLIAGTAACAAPGTSGPAAGGATMFGATSLDPAVPSEPSAPSEPTAPLGGSFTIDWPTPAPAPAPATIASGPPTATPQSAPPAAATPASGVSPTPAAPPTTDRPAPAPAVPSSDPESLTAEPVPGSVSETPGPSSAAPAPLDAPLAAATAAAVSPDISATADPPPSSAAPADQSAAAEPSRAVTVQAGDSLWRIAAHSLGPDATDTEIDNAWRAWYFANIEVIGDNPDTILPGQQLTAPGNAGQVRP